jgi:hypothetical protein
VAGDVRSFFRTLAVAFGTAKATGLLAGLALLTLFWVRHSSWLFSLACLMGFLAQTEQLASVPTLRTWQADTPSWWHVLRANSTVADGGA